MSNQKQEEEKQKLLLEMKQNLHDKWEAILQDVEKQKIPVEFIKKLILKLEGKKQLTINIQKLFQQGLENEQIEIAVGKKLQELDDVIISIEFVLNLEAIAETIQPHTDRLLYKL